MSVSFGIPQENLLQFGLRAGMKIGDFGAGSGHYTRAAAAIVGTNGKVYAIDIQEEVLKHLKLNTRDQHQNIIETVWGDIEKRGGTHIRTASLDAVLLANTFFQVENRSELVSEIQRVLKPGGKLMLVDWAGSFGGIGPMAESVVSEQDAETFFTQAGFHKVKNFRAGMHHYAILFTAP